MRQMLMCLLLAACLPTENAITTWAETTTALLAHYAPPLAKAADAKASPAHADMAGGCAPRRRPVNKNRCLDSAAAGAAVWTAFCGDIEDASLRKRCFEVSLESEQRRKGFCHNFF
jgi:hypothetical protein